MKKAPLIIFDGIDGSGKSTQAIMLKERLEGKHKVCFTREPGGAPLSEEIRNLFSSPEGAQASARTQFLLLSASHSHWLEEVALPNLKEGTPVVSERGDSSLFAYQLYTKDHLDLENLFWEMRNHIFGEYRPTVYLIFDVSPVEAKRRVNTDSTRTKSLFDMEPIEFYERARAGFQMFAKKLSGEVILIDGDRDTQTIHEEVYQIVSKTCGWEEGEEKS